MLRSLRSCFPGYRGGRVLIRDPKPQTLNPVGHSRVWPCPGPRARGLGLGPSKSTGPVGHSKGLALSWPAHARAGPVGHSRVWFCPGPRAHGLDLGLDPSKSTGPVGHSRVWPCPGPRARAALALASALPDRPVESGFVLARARAALALALALPNRPALLGTWPWPWPFQSDRPCWALLALPNRPAGLALSWPARARPWPWPWPFQIDRPC